MVITVLSLLFLLLFIYAFSRSGTGMTG